MLRRLLVAVLATWYQAKLEARSRARANQRFDERDPERLWMELRREFAKPLTQEGRG